MALNRTNLAGIVSLKLLAKADVTSMPELNLARTETVGPVVTSATWTDVVLEKHSGVMMERCVQKRGVAAWEVELTGDHVEESRLYHDSLSRRYIADITDANGTRVLVGTKDEPLTLSFKHDSGKPSAGRKVVLSLTGELSERSPVYVP